MRPIIPAAALLLTAALLPACGTTSFFKGQGSGYSFPPSAVQIVRAKDDITTPYREVGLARAKAATAQQAVDLAKESCARRGGGDLLIMNTEPFQSGDRWRVDATCAISEAAERNPPAGSSKPVKGGGKPAAGSGKPTGTGKAIQ